MRKLRWKGSFGTIKVAVVVIVLVAVLVLFLSALSSLGNSQKAEGKNQLEESIRRAAVACYATEGVYPPNLEYLEENYGIQINRDRYTVFYEIFASNMMPDITVLEY